MLINGVDVSIDDLSNVAQIDKIMLKKIKNNIYLNDYQINILDRYNIDYKSCNSIEELIYKIEYILTLEKIDELEEVSDKLSELKYYYFTKK